MKKILCLLFIVLSFHHYSFSQDQHLVDSLEAALKNHDAHKQELQIKKLSQYDTTAALILTQLSVAYWSSSADKAIDYAKQCLALSEQIGFETGIGSAYNSMGNSYHIKGDYVSALEFHKKALKIGEEIGVTKSLAGSYNNIGKVYISIGNYPDALKNFFAALRINEQMGNKRWQAINLNNIGYIYFLENNNTEALKQYSAALKIGEAIGDKTIIQNSLSAMSNVYIAEEKYDDALRIIDASLKIYRETGNKEGIAGSCINLSEITMKKGSFTDALKHASEALKMYEETGDQVGVSNAYSCFGEIYLRKKEFAQSSEYFTKALSLAKTTGNMDLLRGSHEAFARLDSAKGNFKESLEHYKQFIAIRDSSINNENTRKTTQLQMQYEFDKKQIADSVKFAQEKELATVKLQKQKAITYGGFAGIIVTIVLLFFVYRNYSKQRIANQRLKEAQEQLIKSEKMAAFGVMASRVSHEIQNPLNFVNNFSEIAEEMVSDIVKSSNEQEREETAKDLINNLQKIKQHGKRADAIVKQLQEHTNKGTAHEFFEEKA